MSNGRRPVLVWDLATRLFHWLAAALVAAEYVTWRINWMDWHAWVGYGLLALLFFRVLWGFFGSETARFKSFLAAPRTAVRYLMDSLRREPDRQAGHNPAGGWMVLVLLALLFAETLTGLYVNNDVADEGPLTELTPAPVADAITNLHAILWNALLAAVALHLLAILVYAVAKGHNLLLPMITGRKNLPKEVRAPRIEGPVRALLLLAGGGIAAAVLVNFL
jgi:cytochrome b